MLRSDSLPQQDLLSWILHGSQQAPEEPPAPKKKKPIDQRPPRLTSSVPTLPSLGKTPRRPRPMQTTMQSKVALLGAATDTFATGPPDAVDVLPEIDAAHVYDRAVRLAVERMTSTARVSTPQYAARRELPSSSEPQLSVQMEQPPPSYGWQPPSDLDPDLDGYFYHEPGQRVRESLLTLEEWRRTGVSAGGGRTSHRTRRRRETGGVRASRHGIGEERDASG
jgi:hypothetical protein